MRSPLLRCAATLVLAGLLAPLAAAHDGPPYPILVDEVVSGWTVSVWADPDVGTGTFYYYVDAPVGCSVDGLSIETIARAEDDPDSEIRGRSEPAAEFEPFQLIGTLEFSHRGTWPTRFVLHGCDDRILGELTFDLNVTPPGLGVLDILWFGLPFLAVAALWLRIFLAQRAHERALPLSPDLDS